MERTKRNDCQCNYCRNHICIVQTSMYGNYCISKKCEEMKRKSKIICSAKNCNKSADWSHSGLQINLCDDCFNTIDFQKHFKLIK